MSTDVDRTDTTLAIPEDHQPGKSVQAQRWNELFNLAKLINTTEIVPKPLRGRPDAIFAVMAVRRGTRHLAADRVAEHRPHRRPARAVAPCCNGR